MLTDDYRVRLEAFEGPLDLLLHLIRRAEVEIHEIPIATIAQQYVEHLKQLEHIDVELAGEFLVMAATLMEIKSRTLMPPEERARAERGARDETDPRTELVRRLLAYRAVREAGVRLDARRVAWQGRRGLSRMSLDRDAMRELAEAETPTDIEDLDVLDLARTYARVTAAVNLDRLGEHRVAMDDTPIELHAADVVDRLDRLRVGEGEARRMPLVLLFEGADPVKRIGLFLACLELTRQRRITIEQDDLSGEISVVRLADEAGEAELDGPRPADEHAGGGEAGGNESA